MERIKSINWRFAIYWFIVMSVTNIYIIPKFVENEPITTKRIIIGIVIAAISGIIMGMLTPKPKGNQQ